MVAGPLRRRALHPRPGRDRGPGPAVAVRGLSAYRQWETERFHCTFHVAEDRSHERFSDAIEIHTIELPKVPSLFARPPGEGVEAALCDWGLFLAARSEKELEVLAMHNPDIAKAKTALDTLSMDPAAQELAEARFKAQVAYKLEVAAREAKGRAEGEAQGLREGEVKGLREAVEAACRALELELSPARLERIRSMDVDALRRFLAAVISSRRWPEE